MDADKDTLTCETQSLSDKEILLLDTQPLNETNADTDAVDGENDDEEVDVVMTSPSNSEVFNALTLFGMGGGGGGKNYPFSKNRK